MNINKLRLKDKSKYCIFDCDKYTDEDELLDNIAKKLEKGIEIIHLNSGSLSTKQFVQVARKIRGLCSIYSALMVIGDRLDVAQIVGADGVFLDENSFDINDAKELLPNTVIIGSCKSNESVDYIFQEGNLIIV